MRLQRLIKNLSLPVRALKYRSIDGLNSRKEFYKIIDRERERANRNNHKVSLLVFNLESFPDNGRESRLLIKNIIKEKRKVDELGWYDKRSVGIIMPYTSSHGARKFSVRLSRTLNFIMPDSFCYLFTYPLEDKTDAQAGNEISNGAEDSVIDIKNSAFDNVENRSDDLAQNRSVRNGSK
jgi:hypothetical protein